MDPIVAITSLATLLWCYATVLGVTWLRAVGRLDRRQHVAHFVSLMGVFVPGMALAVGTVLLGILFGIPAIVLAIAVLFPGAVVAGLQLEVAALTGTDARTDALRIASAVALALAVGTRG